MGDLRVAIQLSEPRFKPNIHFALAWKGPQGMVSKWTSVNTRGPGRTGAMGTLVPVTGPRPRHLLPEAVRAMGSGPRMSVDVRIEDDKSMRYDFRGHSIEKQPSVYHLHLWNTLLE